MTDEREEWMWMGGIETGGKASISIMSDGRRKGLKVSLGAGAK